ncbi:transcriptional regulator, TetR family [Streptoalloteichus tenebrarius]|uniref:Transcriptional regulator, TetR family n=1 Tax=Streptoalloteichus tenebrarius (strain ATCC 17920 / DSM 40477 / JCM 4838 / CBS 697.72 / NBRC 16177 / NCIMB 11028 / NRRL B-12390 / A12253. 1 / ISP 5477) TaxID=1933 RepID=A0ABT1HV62_STRSD|nr:TetR/AcrR family transcriptional regulator [Streptoalloteichus tenebrarius]MCP2259405.1 transcriptional regulator, TetR family [Streptoalloteichus tenebrarius]BFF02347.1 hypothetical protein GCM10020241_40220 [Streptoalloteichus tenebrarius]
MRRTRASLRAAALELAAERDLDAIAVADIAERAGISRATVYLHYRDRDDLLLDAVEDAVRGLASAAARCPALSDRSSADEPPPAVAELFEHVRANDVLYTRMLGPSGSGRFAARLREAIASEIAEQLAAARRSGALAAVPLTVRADYLSGALLGVIAGWLAARPRPGVAEISRATWVLLRLPG